MSASAPAPRPGSVTTVVVITWIVAVLTILGGVLFLVMSDSALSEAGISGSTATTYGIVELILGAIIALVAIGLGSGNNFARILVSILMVLRLGVAIWAGIVLWGHGGFWSVVIAGLLALLVLALLWNDRANEFFATN
jgi:hypothetical protein